MNCFFSIAALHRTFIFQKTPNPHLSVESPALCTARHRVLHPAHALGCRYGTVVQSSMVQCTDRQSVMADIKCRTSSCWRLVYSRCNVCLSAATFQKRWRSCEMSCPNSASKFCSICCIFASACGSSLCSQISSSAAQEL